MRIQPHLAAFSVMPVGGSQLPLYQAAQAPQAALVHGGTQEESVPGSTQAGPAARAGPFPPRPRRAIFILTGTATALGHL